MKPPLIAILALMLFAVSFGVRAQSRSLESAEVCANLYAEAPQGGQAVHVTRTCKIPDIERTNRSFRQGDFNCCGGGAQSAMTNANVPAGLELRVTGGLYWAVTSITLSKDELAIGMYCGPSGGSGGGCNIKVSVIAHYLPLTPQQQTPGAEPTSASSLKAADVKPVRPGISPPAPDEFRWTAVGILVLIIAFLVIVYFVRPPRTTGQYDVLRVLCSLAAGLGGALIGGDLLTHVSQTIESFKIEATAGGAVAMFVLVWFTFPKPPATTRIEAGDLRMQFPHPTTFEQAATMIARALRASVTLSGFPEEERTQVLAFFDLLAESGTAAFNRLGELTGGRVGRYDVEQRRDHFELRRVDAATSPVIARPVRDQDEPALSGGDEGAVNNTAR